MTVGIRILAAGPPTTGRAQGWAPPIGKAENSHHLIIKVPLGHNAIVTKQSLIDFRFFMEFGPKISFDSPECIIRVCLKLNDNVQRINKSNLLMRLDQML